MKNTRFTFIEKFKGLLGASVAAYFLGGLILLIISAYANLSLENWFIVLPAIIISLFGMVIYAIIGIPVAALYCLVLGLPLWVIAEKLGAKTNKDALITGAISGALLCVAFILAAPSLGGGDQLFRQAFYLLVSSTYCAIVGSAAFFVADRVRRTRLPRQS